MPIGTEEFDEIAAWVVHPLNDSLYRQQALGWAAAVPAIGHAVCRLRQRLGSKPEFAAFARGPVQYGPELEALTRKARINLQIVPYLCLHQRLLDGLDGRRLFLVRRAHTADTGRTRPDRVSPRLTPAGHNPRRRPRHRVMTLGRESELTSPSSSRLPSRHRDSDGRPVAAVTTFARHGLRRSRRRGSPPLRT